MASIQEFAREKIVELLSAVHTDSLLTGGRRKRALMAFEDYYFHMAPVLSDDLVLLLLRGESLAGERCESLSNTAIPGLGGGGEKRLSGLVAACGLVKRGRGALKKMSTAAFALLDKLLGVSSKQINPQFLSIFTSLGIEHFAALRLEKHIKESNNALRRQLRARSSVSSMPDNESLDGGNNLDLDALIQENADDKADTSNPYAYGEGERDRERERERAKTCLRAFMITKIILDANSHILLDQILRKDEDAAELFCDWEDKEEDKAIAEEGATSELNELGFGGDNDPDTWEGVIKIKEKEKEKEKEEIESRGAGGPASITRQTSELLAENGTSINGVVIRRRGVIGEAADSGPIETDPLGLTQSDLRSFSAGNDRMQKQRERMYRDKGKQRKFRYGAFGRLSANLRGNAQIPSQGLKYSQLQGKSQPNAAAAAIEGSIFLSDERFDARLFLSQVHQNTVYEDLEQGLKNLQEETSNRHVQLRKLVRNNFSKFIHAQDTVESIHQFIQENENQPMFTELNNNATASKAQSRKQGYSAMTMVGEGEKSIDAAVTTAEAGLALFSKHVEKRRLQYKVRLLSRVLQQQDPQP